MPDEHRKKTGPLGAGSEATASKQGANEPDESPPLERDHEHKGSYGGEGGAPRTSSDTREPH